jgi:hypothetical protein
MVVAMSPRALAFLAAAHSPALAACEVGEHAAVVAPADRAAILCGGGSVLWHVCVLTPAVPGRLFGHTPWAQA